MITRSVSFRCRAVPTVFDVATTSYPAAVSVASMLASTVSLSSMTTIRPFLLVTLILIGCGARGKRTRLGSWEQAPFGQLGRGFLLASISRIRRLEDPPSRRRAPLHGPRASCRRAWEGLL